jgi:hypothetical protein
MAYSVPLQYLMWLDFQNRLYETGATEEERMTWTLSIYNIVESSYPLSSINRISLDIPIIVHCRIIAFILLL